MSKIEIETLIKAPIERCFDLSLCVDLHLTSAALTNEKAIAGVTKGLMAFGDEVTWEARHFLVTQKLSVKITKFNKPNYFRDSQIKGIFSRFDHDHYFEDDQGQTRMRDIFDFECPMGILGKLAEPIVHWHLLNFLKSRNKIIKSVAESHEWRAFLGSV